MKKGFETYPLWIVLAFNIVVWSVYLAGFYLLYLIWPVLAYLFVIYILYQEFSVYKEGCRHCYYYGKLCGCGRGKLAKIFLKKGDPKKFTEKTVGLKDFIIPSVVNFIPLIAGIYLLIKDFNWFILVVAVWPVIVMFFGNSLLYGELICPNCKQSYIGCPVSKFFMERAKKKAGK
jgi:hypothetical protein